MVPLAVLVAAEAPPLQHQLRTRLTPVLVLFLLHQDGVGQGGLEEEEDEEDGEEETRHCPL